jgi:hypothetical protein
MTPKKQDWKIGKGNGSIWLCLPTDMDIDDMGLYDFEEHARVYSKTQKVAQTILLALMS